MSTITLMRSSKVTMLCDKISVVINCSARRAREQSPITRRPCTWMDVPGAQTVLSHCGARLSTSPSPLPLVRRLRAGASGSRGRRLLDRGIDHHGVYRVTGTTETPLLPAWLALALLLAAATTAWWRKGRG